MVCKRTASYDLGAFRVVCVKEVVIIALHAGVCISGVVLAVKYQISPQLADRRSGGIDVIEVGAEDANVFVRLRKHFAIASEIGGISDLWLALGV